MCVYKGGLQCPARNRATPYPVENTKRMDNQKPPKSDHISQNRTKQKKNKKETTLIEKLEVIQPETDKQKSRRQCKHPQPA